MSNGLGSTNESELRHIAERIKSGHLDAADALQRAFALGAFAIGTAQAREGREARIAITGIRSENDQRVDWVPRTADADGGVVPVVRFGRAVVPIVISAFTSDANTPIERFVRRSELLPSRMIVSPGRVYTKGTGGWSARTPTSAAYDARVHADYLAALRTMSDDQIIGEADIVVAPDSVPVWPVSREPNHFMAPSEVPTLDSWPIRAGDVRALGHISSFFYEPVTL